MLMFPQYLLGGFALEALVNGDPAFSLGSMAHCSVSEMSAWRCIVKSSRGLLARMSGKSYRNDHENPRLPAGPQGVAKRGMELSAIRTASARPSGGCESPACFQTTSKEVTSALA